MNEPERLSSRPPGRSHLPVTLALSTLLRLGFSPEPVDRSERGAVGARERYAETTRVPEGRLGTLSMRVRKTHNAQTRFSWGVDHAREGLPARFRSDSTYMKGYLAALTSAGCVPKYSRNMRGVGVRNTVRSSIVCHCGKPARARGLCPGHLSAQYRLGWVFLWTERRRNARTRHATRAALSDGYVVSKLGLTKEITPPVLIEAKRVQLQLTRLAKESTK